MAVLLVHGASLGYWFHADDFPLLLCVRDFGAFGVWSSTGMNFFRPLTSVSHWLDFSLFGMNATGHHALNILLAMVSAALVVLLARRLCPASPAWVAGVAGLLFAVLPAHAEAIDWVSCRGDLLSTDLGLGALIVAFRGGRGSVLLAAVLAALAIACKESALSLTLFLGGAALISRDRRLLPATFATFAAAVVMFTIRMVTIGHAVVDAAGYKPTLNPLVAIGNAPLFLVTALSPASVEILRTGPLAALAPALSVLSYGHKILGIAIVVLVAVLLRTRLKPDTEPNRTLWVAFAGFFLLALPVLLQGGVYTFSWVSSRYLYFPSASLAIFAALLLGRLPRARAFGVGAALILAYVAGDVPAVTAWGVAGDIARVDVESLLSQTGRVVVLSAPDGYRGAYALHNGTTEALDLLSPGKHPDVVVLSTYMMENRTDVPRLKGRAIIPAPGTLPFALHGFPPSKKVSFGIDKLSITSDRIEAIGVPGVRCGVLTPAGLMMVFSGLSTREALVPTELSRDASMP